MANLKNITELPVAESAEGLKLIVNDNGAAKQIPVSAVDGKVKTVNSISPDENGNVQIDTASSWNDLKDKPFWVEEKRTLVVEGIPDKSWGYSNNIRINVNIGEAYIYFIDGIEYTGVGFYDESSGNSVDLKNADGTVVAYLSNTSIELVASQLDITVSHKIELVEYVIHKLDAKYLPSSIFYIDAYHDGVHITTNTDFNEAMSAVRSGALTVLRIDRSVQTGSTKIEYCTNFYINDNSFDFETSDYPVVFSANSIYEDN